MEAVRDILAAFGALVIALASVVGALALLMRKTGEFWELLAAWFFGVVSKVSKRLVARKISTRLQYNLNKWIAALNQRLPLDLKVPGIKIAWVDAQTSVEVLERGGCS